MLLSIADSSEASGESGRLAFATFERCRAEIDTAYLSGVNLKEIASRCGVDSAYLCRLFRRFDGSTPYQYLQRLRMHWAAEQLHDSSRRIRDVAEALSIDPFQFSRTFKRVHGLSPSAFQRRRG